MAVVMFMHWPGATPEQYDQAWEKLGVDDDPADGGLMHSCWFDDHGMHVVDVWESQGQFESFMGTRLQPVVSEVGIEGEPQVTFHDLHNRWVSSAA
jgi:hypothetical protein